MLSTLSSFHQYAVTCKEKTEPFATLLIRTQRCGQIRQEKSLDILIVLPSRSYLAIVHREKPLGDRERLKDETPLYDGQ